MLHTRKGTTSEKTGALGSGFSMRKYTLLIIGSNLTRAA